MSHSLCIGLEIHLSVKTDYKMFSPDKVDSVSWKSCGLPGTLPSVNYEAVKKTIQLAYALNCKINYQSVRFDRKNYFYYDLPRGYQITQYFFPIGRGGYLELSNGKKIFIKQVHLEEDTAQQIKSGHSICLSFSRLGQALIEVVTEPNFSSYEEVEDFLQRLRWISLLLNVSDASYSEGKMRVDINISIQDESSNFNYPKSEIKNLNSGTSIKKSIDYLFNKQKKLLKAGAKIESYTYAWVEKFEKCEVMRKKESFKKYFFIPESNIPPLKITDDQYKEIVSSAQVDLSSIIQVLKEGQLEQKEIVHLLNNNRLLTEVLKLNNSLKNLQSSYNWIVNVISGIANKSSFKDYSYEEVEKAIYNFEVQKELNQKQAKSIIKEIITNNVSYKRALKNLKIEKMADENELFSIINSIFEDNIDQLPSLLNNLVKLSKFVIGECMKRTSGQADPIKAKKIFDEILEKYKNMERFKIGNE